MNEKMHRYADRSRDAEAVALAASVHYPRHDWVLSWEHVEGNSALVLLEVPAPETPTTVKYLLVHRTPRTARVLVDTDARRHAEVYGPESAIHGLPDRIRDALGLGERGPGEASVERLTAREHAQEIGGRVLAAGAGAVRAGIKGASPKLHEAGAAALEAAQPALREAAVEAIREALLHLTPDEKKALLREPWVTQALSGKCDPTAGHCYTATEVLYRLLGGVDSGLTPATVNHEGVPHWFVTDDAGNVIDATSEQFRTPVPYDRGVPRSFPEEPTARAHLLGTKVVERLTDADREAILMRAKRGLRAGARYGIMGPFGMFEHPLAATAAKKTAQGVVTLVGAPELAVPVGIAIDRGDLATRAPEGEPTVWDDAKEGYRRYQEHKAQRPQVEKMRALPVEDCPGSLFHVTTYDRVARIAEEGLEPGHGSQWSGGSYDAHVAGRVFLAKGAQSARGWFHATLYAAHASVDLRETEDLERAVPVILRIERADNPRDDIEHKLTIDERGSERESCSFFLEAAIGPEFLSFWNPEQRAWMPLSQWDNPGVEHGVVGGTIAWENDGDGEPRLSDDIDIIDSWQPGGFKPDRPADYETPLSVDDVQINEPAPTGGDDWPTVERLRTPRSRQTFRVYVVPQSEWTTQQASTPLRAATQALNPHAHPAMAMVHTPPSKRKPDTHQNFLGLFQKREDGTVHEVDVAAEMAAERRQSEKLKRWDNPTQVQTLLFSREHFTEMTAGKWARQHGFFATKVDVTEHYIRLRQRDPAVFVKGHFRTIPFGDDTGIKAIVGEPRTA